MEYLDPSEARARPGLRLALTVGGPGPWSEAAKAAFQADGVPFLPVRQDAGEANEALRTWTGHRNAPIAVWNDEPPRVGWSEILLLAERLAPEPRLVPEDPEQRALVFGLGHEICGEQGLGWSRRHLMFEATLGARRERGKPPGRMGTMARWYGFDPERLPATRRRVIGILEMLAARLDAQRAAGSDYFVGDSLTAVDLYWACFCAMFAPLPEAQCPMPEPLRALYTVTEPDLAAALRPNLLAHRDRIYARHLVLPLDF